jgi:hypothetical protein
MIWTVQPLGNAALGEETRLVQRIGGGGFRQQCLWQ